MTGTALLNAAGSQRKPPLLAVCIPVFNREQYIGETLSSVLAEADDRVEICISDNASTDDTLAVARRALGDAHRARIAAQPENRGADANYLAAVALAEARHCLILGSDDTLAPGALGAILERLEHIDPDILLFDRRTCTRDMQPIRVEHSLREARERSFAMAAPDGLAAYLEQAVSLTAAFSYLSSVVFRKSEWDLASCHEVWVDSAYVHSYKLLNRCCAGARVHYLPSPLVNCRLGNDSFRNQGLARRVLIDLEGFGRLAGYLTSQGQEQAGALLRGLIRSEYPFWRIVRYQHLLAGDPAWPEILARLRQDFGVSVAWTATATLLGSVPGVARASFILRDLLLRHLNQGLRTPWN